MGRPGVVRPPVRAFRLANGLRVLLAPDDRSPTASVWVWYRVGSKNEHPGITGASHWVEHMLFEGSPRYPKGAIDRAVLRVGGELNAFTDTDFTAYFTTVPREHLGVPLDFEADRMTRAAITDGEVARERTVIHSEREGNENWPEFRVEEELFQLAFRVDHRALAIDLPIRDERPGHPVRLDIKRHLEVLARYRGEVRREVGVGERVELPANADHGAIDLPLRVPRAALEEHVLDPVRRARDAGALVPRTDPVPDPDARGRALGLGHQQDP